MTFNKATIGGKSYGEVVDARTGEVIEIGEVLAFLFKHTISSMVSFSFWHYIAGYLFLRSSVNFH